MAGNDKATLKTRALRYLARREYSRQELTQKLSAYASSIKKEELTTVLDDLEQRGFLSAQRVIEQITYNRRSRYGSQRIIQELKSKGIDAQLINDVLPTLKANDEETALAIWQKKFGRLPTTAEERAKQMRFMLNRGFSTEIIREVLARASDSISKH
ncbi:regulatory protein [Nitrosomonas sp. PY1]|uniref:recombination regulator RecX n=1 Tax=Nitrosomonas sp. PY1 TaxID=1803906 RepID=UPI001FC86D9D|nr:recombination regulator RecX [Nitrosomonas sp. PY1]GKS70098.1 regulatory protein [Nitrosomonas sp. PY1]